MSFINWGNDSADLRAIRARLEQEALYEQAVRMANARNRGNNSSFGGAGSAGIQPSTPVQPPVDPSANNYVENDYIDDYFE
jgi:hypothetical protein